MIELLVLVVCLLCAFLIGICAGILVCLHMWADFREEEEPPAP